MKKHIVVIGGGIAGTSAAYRLSTLGYDVTILEKNNRLGGRIHSVNASGITFELGAGFMTNAYTNLLAFAKAQRLDTKLSKKRGNSGIFRGNSVTMASASTFSRNDVLPFGAKLQALSLLGKVIAHWRQLDIHAPWKAHKLDHRSVSELFSGKNGELLLEYVIQPVLNGYFYWKPEQTSEAMLLSIIKAVLQGGSYKMQGGLQQLPEAAARNSKVLLGHTVNSVTKTTSNKYEVLATHNNKQITLQADGIVCATTASVVSSLFTDLTVAQKDFFGSVHYSSTALIAQTYPEDETLGARGIAFPRKENSNLAAITISPEPGDQANSLHTVKIYAADGTAKELSALSDDQVTATLTKLSADARKVLLAPGATPLTTTVQHWPEALPLFSKGHYAKLKDFVGGTIENPAAALVFAGDYLGGPLMEGAFTSGTLAAERLHTQLR